MVAVHTVVETPSYLNAAAAAGITAKVREQIVTAVAKAPMLGNLMVGTGGLRKFRFARPGGGKSGGFRILSYYVSGEFPVFLIGAFGKGDKANLTAAERNEVARRLRTMAATYKKKSGTR
jgi:hypothetical protein